MLNPRVDIDFNTRGRSSSHTSETTMLTVASTVGRLHVSSQRQDAAVSDKVK